MRKGTKERQERFFAEYERCGDGARAAVAASYDERLAAFTAGRLLEAKARAGEGVALPRPLPPGGNGPLDPRSSGVGRFAESLDDTISCLEGFQDQSHAQSAQPALEHPQAPEPTATQHRGSRASSRPGGERSGEGQSPSPATPPVTNVTREMVVSGLYEEASGEGKDPGQANRIKAWELLAKVLGLLGQSGQSGRSGDEADEPLLVRFDIRLDDEAQAAGSDGEAGR